MITQLFPALCLLTGVLLGNWLAYRNGLKLSPMPQIPQFRLRRHVSEKVNPDKLPEVRA